MTQPDSNSPPAEEPTEAPLEKGVQPDPGNSPPERWTAPLSPEDRAQVEEDLRKQLGGGV